MAANETITVTVEIFNIKALLKKLIVSIRAGCAAAPAAAHFFHGFP
jgi:hypothetical protein